MFIRSSRDVVPQILIFVALFLGPFAGTGRLLGQVVPPLQCIANAGVPPQVRAEGLTEFIGDIILNCNGGTPTAQGQAIPQANITIFLNTSITSRVLANGLSEALLLVDEPGTASNPQQQLCVNTNGCVVTGTGGTSEPFSGNDATRPNIFQGIVSNNSVTFIGVPLDPPGTTRSRTYRMTNIRANATTIAPAGSVPGQIVAFISATPSTSLPINNPQQIVGFVSPGLTFGGGGINVLQCVGITDSNRLAVLSYSEGFPTAFRPRTAAGPSGVGPQNTPGLVYNNESGFVFSGLPTAGLADWGTRFKAVFRNIPAGVSLWVSTTNFGGSANSTTGQDQAPTARLVSSETGGFSPVPATTTLLGFSAVQLPVASGSATAVWEVTAADPLFTESFSFGTFMYFTGTLDLATPPATVNGTLAPAPPTFTLSDGAKAQPAPFSVPRFIDNSVPSTILTVAACHTNLLFPFVTAQSGFDTGFSISNTSTDPFGTLSQSGTCSLSFYGMNAPGALITPIVGSGKSYSAIASTIAPNFQGYVIAICNFQYAHGFAFISDVGARNLAMGYLSLIIPEPPTPRTATPFECGGTYFSICASSGEQLGF